ncbi:hypothetical protein OAC97_01375 [Flavobacteriaceae bacterium]|nr:hypothetical protein [Flavobacteriaceae bacterium]MDB9873893.1 hypothetical protein [Flavobacteriaceae bacterium]
MIRKIVDFRKLNSDLLNRLVEKYPDGYDDRDIISFRNANNEVIEAVEIKTEDTIYLIKVGTRLEKAMEDFSERDLEYDDSQVDLEVNFEDEDEDDS